MGSTVKTKKRHIECYGLPPVRPICGETIDINNCLIKSLLVAAHAAARQTTLLALIKLKLGYCRPTCYRCFSRWMPWFELICSSLSAEVKRSLVVSLFQKFTHWVVRMIPHFVFPKNDIWAEIGAWLRPRYACLVNSVSVDLTWSWQPDTCD